MPPPSSHEAKFYVACPLRYKGKLTAVSHKIGCSGLVRSCHLQQSALPNSGTTNERAFDGTYLRTSPALDNGAPSPEKLLPTKHTRPVIRNRIRRKQTPRVEWQTFRPWPGLRQYIVYLNYRSIYTHRKNKNRKNGQGEARNIRNIRMRIATETPWRFTAKNPQI